MSLIEDGLYIYLSTQPNIAEYVGGRVHAQEMPQEPVYPAILFRRVSTNVDYTHTGESGYCTVVMQIESLARLLKDARLIAEQVRRTLSGFKGVFSPVDGDITIHSIFQRGDTDESIANQAQSIKVARVRQQFAISFAQELP